MLLLMLSFLYKRILSQPITLVGQSCRTIYWCLSTILIAKVVCLVWLGTCSALANEQIECLINAKLGFSDPKNIYQCKVPLKCCFEYNKPSCCGSKPSWQIIKEQVTLWGGLFGILLTIASIVYCRKNDITIPGCGAIRDCFVKCCCGGGGGDDNDGRGHDMSLNVSRQSSTMWNSNNSSNKLNNGKTVVIDNGNSSNNVRHGWRKNAVNPIDSEEQINRITNV